jgi:internalin A
MPTVPVSPRRRRFLRLSVRGLIVLVLVIGGGLGWLVHSARIQREAVAAIQRAGGIVRYNLEPNNGNTVPAGGLPAPPWLSDLIGIDYFGHATSVVAKQRSTTSDAVIAQVGRLTRLEVLHLGLTSASDAELAHIVGLTKLKVLMLDGTKVTDVGLVHVTGLTELSVLSLGNTQITDGGLAQLRDCKHLETLLVRHTQVTDAGMKELKQALPNLVIVR